MKRTNAEIIREYGPFPDVDVVCGVSYDSKKIWFATGDRLIALDPASGTVSQSLELSANAGTAWDGTHFYQIAEDHIQKVDPGTGEVISIIPAPGNSSSGMTWAEGSLWIGQYQDRKIHQVDPETGKLLRTIESNRFVTGVTWVDDELWHGSWENGESELRHIDPDTGETLESLVMPPGTEVSGLESDGSGQFFCGGGESGKLRVVRRP
ncbi:glutamine cyclotransferase [Marinobacter sp.]|uniref:Vgb family protein n=1 Tax=Marinobacter sp. TaxID=50741 RepID=UPI003563B6F1